MLYSTIAVFHQVNESGMEDQAVVMACLKSLSGITLFACELGRASGTDRGTSAEVVYLSHAKYSLWDSRA